MPLPIIIIFERHWDKTPKQVVLNLLPKLAAEGYNTLCLEAPQDISKDELLSRADEEIKLSQTLHSQATTLLKRAQVKISGEMSDVSYQNLTRLMHLYVSSQRYVEVAEKIKNLPAALLVPEIMEKATQLSMTTRGIDIESKDFDPIVEAPLPQRMKLINSNIADRNTTMTTNLLELYARGNGVVFICGALHAPAFITFFKQRKMEDQAIICFPHSEKLYDQSVNDIQLLIKEGSPKEKFFLLRNETDIETFSNKIILKVQALIRGDSENISLTLEEKAQPHKDLPEQLNVVDENRILITTFPVSSQTNQERLYELRSVVGDVIKKCAFRPIYEVTQNWLEQVNQANPKGISELAELVGVSEEIFCVQVNMSTNVPESSSAKKLAP